MLASPHTWLKASQVVGEDVHHLVQGGVFVTRVLVERLLADDADGATQTLDFSYRGAAYQIDLSARDARALNKLLAPVLAAARPRDKPPVPHRTVTKAPSGVPTAKTVRAWAKTEGIDVSDRGRIAADVKERYQAAHRA
ncbi:histone-like nucleoid-structuring protein Lsr2 [Nocardioides aquaticus]|nr:Lsr2 family protein [Nocardioides aquaticus]